MTHQQNLRRFCLCIPLSLLLGCSNNTTIQTATSAIAKFSITDLQAALADAQAHDDKIAAQCYPAVIQFVTELQTRTPAVGAFSAFQHTRDVVNSDAPLYLRLGCAALVQDVTHDVMDLLNKLALMGLTL